MWQPTLLESDGPLYERIAASLARDIQAGRLASGSRLPTLKELAAQLGVTPGTVGRAYELAQRRGLVDGEVGRGTFVREAGNGGDVRPLSTGSLPLSRPIPATASDLASDRVDLSIVKPNLEIQEPYLRAALADLAQASYLPEMLDYTPDGGLPPHRQAGATWMQQAGLPARAEQVVLTAGGQHGLWVVINALTRPGDLVFCESLCYPGVASVVHGLGRRLKGIKLDEAGMQADALREACREERPALVICIANCQNPTCSVMPADRRRQIAEIVREFDTTLVDDDIYGFLVPTGAAPLASFAPERSVYLTSLSKSVLSTVRLGYIHAPAEWLPGLAASVRTSIWMVSPLAAQIATILINGGKAEELGRAQQQEARARQQIVREALGEFEFRAQPAGFHIWLKLPPRWSSGDQFASMARSHGLIVAPGSSFAMNRDGEAQAFIRIAIMGGTRGQLRFVLAKLAGLLKTADALWL